MSANSRTIFGQYESGLGDGGVQFTVGGRVRHIDSGAENGDCHTVCFKHGTVHSGVNASRETADDRGAGPSQSAAKHPRDAKSVTGRSASANDRHLWPVEYADVADRK